MNLKVIRLCVNLVNDRVQAQGKRTCSSSFLSGNNKGSEMLNSVRKGVTAREKEGEGWPRLYGFPLRALAQYNLQHCSGEFANKRKSSPYEGLGIHFTSMKTRHYGEIPFEAIANGTRNFVFVRFTQGCSFYSSLANTFLKYFPVQFSKGADKFFFSFLSKTTIWQLIWINFTRRFSSFLPLIFWL